MLSRTGGSGMSAAGSSIMGLRRWGVNRLHCGGVCVVSGGAKGSAGEPFTSTSKRGVMSGGGLINNNSSSGSGVRKSSGSKLSNNGLLLPPSAKAGGLYHIDSKRSYSDGWDEDEDLDQELDQAFTSKTPSGGGGSSSTTSTASVPAVTTGGAGGDGTGGGGDAGSAGADDDGIFLERMARPPGKYDLVTSTTVYKWETTAKVARKVIGPMKEWAEEFKYRTGVHVDVDPIDPEKATTGGYANPDDVELNLYFFGGDRAINQAQSLLKAMVKQDPTYVRLAVFRRREGKDVEWLSLRRINRELRPPDIPPISLKTPGKYTLLFENHVEAAVRTLWEETGIHVEEKNVHATGMLTNSNSAFYWRVPVRYFVAEVPEDVEVQGPQSNTSSYMMGWDPKLLRQSLDPIDRTWGTLADPSNGCCWLTAKQMDELQLPLKGEGYMSTRYTPSPASGLQDVVGLGSTPAAAEAGEVPAAE